MEFVNSNEFDTENAGVIEPGIRRQESDEKKKQKE